jgi:hypothetical protein
LRSIYQAVLPQHTSSFLKTLRHRHGSVPSTGFKSSGHLPVGIFSIGIFSNIILGSPAMLLLEVAFKLLKPTLREAPPQLKLHAFQTPLQPSHRRTVPR